MPPLDDRAETEEEVARRDLREHGGTPVGVTRLDVSDADADQRMNRLTRGRDARTGDTFMEIDEDTQQGNPQDRERLQGGGRTRLADGGDLGGNIWATAGQQYGLDPLLLEAIHLTETGGTRRMDLVSPAGAMGPMQLMPQTARSLGVANPFDLNQAVPAAAQGLSQMLGHYEKQTGGPGWPALEMALKAYNGGTNQAKWNNPETAGYPGKVLQYYNQLKSAPPPMTIPAVSTSAPPTSSGSPSWGIGPPPSPPQQQAEPPPAPPPIEENTAEPIDDSRAEGGRARDARVPDTRDSNEVHQGTYDFRRNWQDTKRGGRAQLAEGGRPHMDEGGDPAAEASEPSPDIGKTFTAPIPPAQRSMVQYNGNVFDAETKEFLGPVPKSKRPMVFYQGNVFDAETKEYIGPAPKDWEPGPKDTGFLGAVVAGTLQPSRQAIQGYQAVTGGKPKAEESQPDILAAQPVTWSDLNPLHPKAGLEKLAYQLSSQWPEFAGAAVGSAAGAAIGAAAGAPAAGVGAVPGAAAGSATGAAVGFGAVAALTSIGPKYAEALTRHPDNSAAAWYEALMESASAGVLGAAGWRLFSWTPFGNAAKTALDEIIRSGQPITAEATKAASRAVTKDLALQLGLAQPAVGAAQRVADNLIEGKHPGEGVVETLPGSAAQGLVPLVGHYVVPPAGRAISRMLGAEAGEPTGPGAGEAGERGAQTPSPPAGETPPEGGGPAPTFGIGSTIGMDFGDGVRPAEVVRTQGDLVYLRDPEGNVRPMTAADVAKYAKPLPEAEPGAAAGENPPPSEPLAAEGEPAAEVTTLRPGEEPTTSREPAAEDPEKAEARAALEAIAKAAGPEPGTEAMAQQTEEVKAETTPPTGTEIPRGISQAAAEEPAAPSEAAKPKYDPQALKAERAQLPDGWTIRRKEGTYSLLDPQRGVVATQDSPGGLAEAAANYLQAQEAEAAARRPVGIEEAQAIGAAAAPPALPSAVPEIPWNRDSLNAYADSVRGDLVKGVSLVGSTAREGKGRDIDIVYDLGERALPEDSGAAAEAVEGLLQSAGDAGLPLDFESYDSFFKVGDRYFHLSWGAGREIVENTTYGREQAGKPVVALGTEGGGEPVYPPSGSAPVSSLGAQGSQPAAEAGPEPAVPPTERPPTEAPPVETMPTLDYLGARLKADKVNDDTWMVSLDGGEVGKVARFLDEGDDGAIAQVYTHEFQTDFPEFSSLNDAVVDMLRAAVDAGRLDPEELGTARRAPAETPPTEAPPAETPPSSLPTVTNEKHTKTGADIYAVRFPQKPVIDDLGAQAKKLGGYWSSYRGQGMQPGWMFKTRDAADQFAAWARDKVGSPAELRPGEVVPGVPEQIAKQALDYYASNGGQPNAITIRQRFNLGPDMARAVAEYVRARLPEEQRGTIEGRPAPAVEKPVESGDKPLESGEHPGLVITSLETGKTTRIQPPGTRPPAQDRPEIPRGIEQPAPGNQPPRAKGWEEVGRNYIGQTLYEDERGVRSIIENGVRRSEPVSLRPTRGGMEIGVDRTERPEYQIAEANQTDPNRPIEYQTPPLPPVPEQAPPDPIRDAAREVYDLWRDTRNVEEAQSRLSYEAGRAGFSPDQVAQVVEEFDRLREQELDRVADEVPRDVDPELVRMRFEVQQAREDTEVGPSEAKKESGVYRKGRVDFNGLPFVLETPEGTRREGPLDEYGKPSWVSRMPTDYGYIAGITGADGDKVDAYLGPHLLSQRAWVIDQINPDTGRFDEHKIMLGFDDWFGASNAYLDAFTDGRGEERLGQAVPMSLVELNDWLKTGNMKEPVGQGLLFNGREPISIPEAENAARDELRGAVPAGDAGAGPEDVSRTAQTRPPRPAPGAQEPGGLRAPETDLAGEREPVITGEAGGGGGREIDLDRLPERGPEGDEREPGAAGRPDGAAEPGPGAQAGRVPDADRFAGLDFQVKGQNHVIEPGAVDEGRSPRIKAKDNLAAIALAKEIAADGRAATKAEQEILAKYVGWGGLPGAFPDAQGKMRKGFEDIGDRLKKVLDPAEYRTAARSTQYAHYTAENVIRSMWDAVQRMGFKGGMVFEPGMGVGHFLGMMPPDLAQASKYQGVELDHVTADIAKLLYPQSGVRQADFTRTALPRDVFDLAIGNPPFGDITIKSDPKYAARGFLLHDYFFAKSLDGVRPGGLLAFVTSAGTMNKMDDAARRYMAERAEFVGGVRLPSSAFARNAGTEVTTDILFFKKRPTAVSLAETPDWAQTVMRSLPGPDGAPVEGPVSRYFSEHPEMVLGDEGFFDKLYKGRYGVHETPDTDLTQRLQEALGRLPENIVEPPLSPEQKAALDFNAAVRKEGSFYVGDDGRLMQYLDGAGRPVPKRGGGIEGGYTQKEVEKIRQLVPLRDAMLDVYRADLAGTADAAEARARLNRIYDEFVKQNGPINKADISYRRPNIVQQESARHEAREDARELGTEWREGDFDPSEMIAAKAKAGEIARARQQAREAAKGEFDEGTFDPASMPDIPVIRRENIDAFMDDQDSYRMMALEDYDPQTGIAQKRRVFNESILTREEEPQLNSANDGLLWSVNKFGKLDVDAIAAKLGRDPAAVIKEMGDNVMLVPGTDGTYEPRDQYLSGDVVSKLEEASAAARKDPRFLKNVAALEQVQPKPLSPAEIAINLGMPWVPVEVVNDFVAELGIGRVPIKYSDLLGRWILDTRNGREGPNFAEWGVVEPNSQKYDLTAHEILDLALNRKTARVTRTDRGPPQRTWVDEDATQAGQDRIDRMKQRFRDWVDSDQERGDNLASIYNDKFNRVVLRQWNGDYLTTPGVSSEWSWRPHQTRGIARIIQSGNTYLAHEVGSGKTSLMIGAAMEQRRLGLINKPTFVVPNHMLAQFAKEFYEQYPTARIRVADDRNFHTSRRKQFIADVAAQDLDGVIITDSAFKKIPISQEFGDQLVQEHIDEIDEALRELGQDPSATSVSREARAQGNLITVKKLQKMKEKAEQRMRGAMNADKDEVINFEEMGTDFLFVDEAHGYRKLGIVTQTPMKGISTEGSNKAWDLYSKIRYLDQNRPGRSVVMASGTPITNTMGELYTLSKYMQPEALKERGLAHFDSWAQSFGDTKTELEQLATGEYEPVTRFAKFVNIPELYKMVGSTMDVVTGDELSQYVTRPELEGGKRQFHLAERTPWMIGYQQSLADRVKAIRERGRPAEKGEDILLAVINDGRNAALDPRLVDPSLPREVWQDSKLNEMIGNVHRVWQESKDQQFYDPASEYKKPAMRGPATQMVFSNFGMQSGDGRFSAYQWMKREWQRMGIPPGEIAFMRDAKTPVEKQRLINDMNDGKVRILVGSVAKMGTGINAQRRLLAIHNLDPLWYPADDTQRNGRGLRQGNFNPELQIHDYSTKGTYDSTMWGMMGRKGRFIEQFFRGDPNLREMEDLFEAGQYEQASAMATADERVIRLTEMKQELDKLERRERAHDTEQFGYRSNVQRYQREATYNEQVAAGLDDAIARRQDINGDNFKMTVDGETYTDRAKAGEALDKLIGGNLAWMRRGQSAELGEIAGFPLSMTAREGWLDGPAQRRGEVAPLEATVTLALHDAPSGEVEVRSRSGAGLIQSAAAEIRSLESDRAARLQRRQVALERMESNRAAIGKEFADRDKIKPLSEQVAALEAEIQRGPADQAQGPLRPTEISPTGEMVEAREPTVPGRLAEKEPTGRVEPARDLTDSARNLRQAFPDTAAGGQQAARQFVLTLGSQTGHEHFGAVDPRTGEIVDAGTSSHPNQIMLGDESVKRLFDPDGSRVDYHHNHPSNLPISTPDLSLLAARNMGWVVAHGSDGEMLSAARLTPDARAWLSQFPPDSAQAMIIGKSIAATDIVQRGLNGLVDSGRISMDEADAWTRETSNTALAALGLTDYMSSRDLPSWARPYAARAARELQRGVPWQLEPEDIFDRLYRSAGVVSAESGMARLSRTDEGAAAGRPAGEGGDQGGGARPQPAAQPGAAPEEGLGWRLGEDPRSDIEALARSLEKSGDVVDETSRATLEAARLAAGGGGPRWIDRFRRTLGGFVGPPERGQPYRFNILNRWLTTPLGLAALDETWARKIRAEFGKNDMAAERSKSYFAGLDSWNKAPAVVQAEADRFLEIVTLLKQPVVRDGRSLVAENDGSAALKHAHYSKPGDIARLSPEATELVVDHLDTMDRIHKDYVAEVARKNNWEGEPTAAAIYKAAQEAKTGAEQKSLKETAAIVAAIEYAKQESYLPLTRTGDYYFRVLPKIPSEVFTGEGGRPTQWFDLINSLTPGERFAGGVQRGMPQKVVDHLAELRQRFPEDQFDVEHGYAFRKADLMNDLNVSGIDKLLMLVGNDAKGELRKGFQAIGANKAEAEDRANKAYDDLKESIFKQINEERTASHRRRREGIAGYDSNFRAATSQYTNWLAHSVADMRFRPEIEAADQALAAHPDERMQQYTRDYNRMMENAGFSDQLHGPLARLRQMAFAALLGGNAATSIKILLHGPARFMPIVGTGLGPQGRAYAAASYLSAHAQLWRGVGIGKNGIEADLMRPIRDAEERGVMQRAIANDVVHEQTHDEMALRRRELGDESRLSDRGRFMRRIFDIWTSNVSAADRLIRGSALLSAYRTANRVGMDAINRTWNKDPYWRDMAEKTPESFANFMVRYTVGQWGPVNRMPILRTTLGALAGQMKTYEIGYTSNLYHMMMRMGPEGKATAALMLGGLSAMGGALAMPFAADAETAAETVFGWITGLEPNLEEKLENLVNAIFGQPDWGKERPAIGEAVMHGPARLVTGVDWGSLSFGDLLSRNMKSPVDLLGAAASTAFGKPQRAFERYRSGQDPLSALTELAPTGIQAMIHAYAPETTLQSARTGTPVMSPEALSTADRAKMVFNLRPAQIPEKYEDINRISHTHQAYTHAISQAESRIANLLHRGNTEEAATAMGEARQLVAEAIRSGGFSQAEIATFNRQLRQAIMRREHPETPSRTQQRVNAGPH